MSASDLMIRLKSCSILFFPPQDNICDYRRYSFYYCHTLNSVISQGSLTVSWYEMLLFSGYKRIPTNVVEILSLTDNTLKCTNPKIHFRFTDPALYVPSVSLMSSDGAMLACLLNFEIKRLFYESLETLEILALDLRNNKYPVSYKTLLKTFLLVKVLRNV